MARWSVNLVLVRVKQLGTARTRNLGTVTAPTEKLAIARAADEFHIAPARQNKIVVTKISDKDDD
jgi:hypothetical protein